MTPPVRSRTATWWSALSRDDVSRETIAPPEAPAWAAQVFGDRLTLAERYVESLADEGVVRGLIGPRETPRLWERHVLNCAVLADAIERDAKVADVGSGAGLPGVALAIARPDLEITLVEPLLRRTVYLEQIVDELGVNARVVRARAEDVEATFDVVTARAVADLAKLMGWCWPLVCRGGSLLAMKGRSATEEVERAKKQLSHPDVASVRIEALGPVEAQTTAVLVRRR